MRPTKARNPNRALLIGVDQYVQQDLQLKGCKADVAAWILVLERLGFHTSPVLDPTFEGAMQALTQFARATEANDRVVVFYAGHGDVRVEQVVLRRYLCPTDAEVGLLDSKIDIDSALLPLFDRLEVPLSLHLILDACFLGLEQGVALRSSSTVRSIGPVAVPAHFTLPLRASSQATVVTLSASTHLAAHEVQVGPGWQGAFSLAATTVLNRWPTAVQGSDSAGGLTYRRFLRSVAQITSRLHAHQDPDVRGPVDGLLRHAVLQREPRPPVPTRPRPPLGAPRQVSAGFDGFRVYQGKVGNTVVLQVIVTRPDFVAAGWDPDTEYWEAKGALLGQDFVFELVYSGTAADVAKIGDDGTYRRIGGTRWIAELSNPVPYAQGTLPGGQGTWFAGDLLTPSLPYLKLLVENSATVWVRAGSQPLGASWGVGDHLSMTATPSALPFQDAYLSEDEWLPWP